jgi:hypothetical protein
MRFSQKHENVTWYLFALMGRIVIINIYIVPDLPDRKGRFIERNDKK